MKDFYIKNGKLMVEGAAYAVSNENTGVVAVVPSIRKIRAVIRQLFIEHREMFKSFSYNVPTYIWSFTEHVSLRVLPVGKCPLWYRDFLDRRCYQEVLKSTHLFKMEKDPAMGYELKLTPKKSVKL